MNRWLTNSIRFVMDECLPPIIRDNRFFMYPFFYVWYKGRNIKRHMNFKTLVYDMTPEEFEQFYHDRKSLATDRPTDLSDISIRYMLGQIDPEAKTLVDIGCGNGFFLREANKTGLECHGCDLQNTIQTEGMRYHYGNIENLPFTDKEFDVVTCHHTIEHIIDSSKAIAELKRIARKQLIIVVPCQRPLYYTLDEHVHFFPYEALLTNLIGLKNYTCTKIWSDWVYIGYPD